MKKEKERGGKRGTRLRITDPGRRKTHAQCRLDWLPSGRSQITPRGPRWRGIRNIGESPRMNREGRPTYPYENNFDLAAANMHGSVARTRCVAVLRGDWRRGEENGRSPSTKAPITKNKIKSNRIGLVDVIAQIPKGMESPLCGPSRQKSQRRDIVAPRAALIG